MAVSRVGRGISGKIVDFKEGCESSKDVNMGSNDSDGRLAKE
jgi:hypothetical protein